MVSTTPSYQSGGGETICPSFLPKLCPRLSLLCRYRSITGKPIPKYNRHAPTGWLILLGELTGEPPPRRKVRSYYEKHRGAHLLGWIATRPNTSSLPVL